MKSKRDEFYQRKKKEKEGREVKKCICAGCYNRTSDWEVYKQQTFISHNSGTGKSKIEAPADSVSGESILPGLQTAIPSHRREREL